jgi:hypothetical protein
MFTGFPFPQTGETETPGSVLTSANAFLAFSLQMRIDVAVDFWSLELLVAAGSLTSTFPGGSMHPLC